MKTIIPFLLFIAFVPWITGNAVELTINDVTNRSVRVGRLLPPDPSAVVGQIFKSWCTLVRRKILRNLGITTDDIFFQFYQNYDAKSITVSQQYVTKLNHTTVELNYPNITIEYHKSLVQCLARINKTSVLFIDEQLLYAGYSPGVGKIENIITEDLATVTVTFTKSHPNPSYPTTFILLCRFRKDEGFGECPSQKTISNDTIEFTVELEPGEKFGSNRQPIDICVKSFSMLGGTAIGEVTTFSLYDKFKPASVSDINVKYSGGQNASIQWSYSDPVPIPLNYTVWVLSRWQLRPQIYYKIASYFECGPFTVMLSNLTWATTYQVNITVKPVTNGYLSDPRDIVNFTTEEGIPSMNPTVIRSGYERKHNGEKQDVIVYWQPVPERSQNGIITQVIVELLTATNLTTIYVSESEAMLHQVRVENLQQDVDHLFWVKIGTKKGLCHHATNHVNVVSQDRALPPLENLTALIITKSQGRPVVQLSWKPYTIQYERMFVHWCVGSLSYSCKGVLNSREVLPGSTAYTFDNLEQPFLEYRFGMSVEGSDSNSGIHWASCTYDVTKVPKKLSEVRSAEVSENSATLFIKPGLCTPEQGYTYKITVVIHELNKDVSVQTFPVSLSDTYTVTGLKPSTDYRLEVFANSLYGQSARALEIFLKTEAGASIILFAMVVGILIFTLVIFSLLSYKCFKRWRESIIVSLPDSSNEQFCESRKMPDGKYQSYNDFNENKADDSFSNTCLLNEDKIPKIQGLNSDEDDETDAILVNSSEHDASSLSSSFSRVSPEGMMSVSKNSLGQSVKRYSSDIEIYQQCHISDYKLDETSHQENKKAGNDPGYTDGRLIYSTDEHNSRDKEAGSCPSQDISSQANGSQSAKIPMLVMDEDDEIPDYDDDDSEEEEDV